MLHLIINPVAKRGAGIIEVAKAKEIFASRGVAFSEHYTTHRKHAAELAYKLAIEGAETVVSCGGDGTIHEVVNGLMSAKKSLAEKGAEFITKLALLPCGTGNDYMRSVGMPTDATAAAEVIVRGQDGSIDLIDIDGVYEVCFACRGLDVDVVNAVNAAAKKTESSYKNKVLNCILKGINYDFDVTVDGKRLSFNGIIAAVLNGWSIASGLNFCPVAKVDDGYMDLVFIKSQPRLKTLSSFLQIAKGKIEDVSAVTHVRCKHVEIVSKQKSTDIDGELYDNIHFIANVVPSAIKLIR
jgi:lipid kinase, YegS/Rv2252/BmrU family